MSIKRLHPTLKACHCGFVGPRTAVLDHIYAMIREYEEQGMGHGAVWRDHGEIPLNEDGTTPSGRQIIPTKAPEMEFDDDIHP